MESQKFWFTENHVLDLAVIGEILYQPKGEIDGPMTLEEGSQPHYRKESRLMVVLKEHGPRKPLELTGDLADKAWSEFRIAMYPDVPEPDLPVS
jgi:hypothetical protein